MNPLRKLLPILFAIALAVPAAHAQWAVQFLVNDGTNNHYKSISLAPGTFLGVGASGTNLEIYHLGAGIGLSGSNVTASDTRISGTGTLMITGSGGAVVTGTSIPYAAQSGYAESAGSSLTSSTAAYAAQSGTSSYANQSGTLASPDGNIQIGGTNGAANINLNDDGSASFSGGIKDTSSDASIDPNSRILYDQFNEQAIHYESDIQEDTSSLLKVDPDNGEVTINNAQLSGNSAGESVWEIGPDGSGTMSQGDFVWDNSGHITATSFSGDGSNLKGNATNLAAASAYYTGSSFEEFFGFTIFGQFNPDSSVFMDGSGNITATSFTVTGGGGAQFDSSGNLWLNNTFASGVIVPTGSLIIYDNTGTPYLIPAVPQ